MNCENKIFSSPQTIVYQLAAYFFGNFSTPTAITSGMQRGVNTDVLHLKHVSEDEILKALFKLKPSHTAGPDLNP